MKQSKNIKNKQKVRAKKFELDQIDELKFFVMIVKPSVEDSIVARIRSLGGRILLTKIGEGISKNKSLELLGIQTQQNLVIFGCARKEDANNLLIAIDSEYNLTLPGNGLALTISSDGFMGAKGLFI